MAGGAVETGAAAVVVGRPVLVVASRRLVSGAAVAEAGAATGAVVVLAGHGRPPQAGALGLPKAWRVRIARIAAAATAVAAKGRGRLTISTRSNASARSSVVFESWKKSGSLAVSASPCRISDRGSSAL